MGAAWDKFQKRPEPNIGSIEQKWINTKDDKFIQGLEIDVQKYPHYRLNTHGEADTRNRAAVKMSIYGAACIIGIVMAVFGFLDTTLLPMGVIGLILLVAGSALLYMQISNKLNSITLQDTQGTEFFVTYDNNGKRIVMK